MSIIQEILKNYANTKGFVLKHDLINEYDTGEIILLEMMDFDNITVLEKDGALVVKLNNSKTYTIEIEEIADTYIYNNELIIICDDFTRLTFSFI